MLPSGYVFHGYKRDGTTCMSRLLVPYVQSFASSRHSMGAGECGVVASLVYGTFMHIVSKDQSFNSVVVHTTS